MRVSRSRRYGCREQDSLSDESLVAIIYADTAMDADVEDQLEFRETGRITLCVT
jgi:hypothetical protein